MSLRACAATVSMLALAALVAAIAWAQHTDEILLIAQPVDRDVYAARREINVLGTVDGDLVAAAKKITVDGEVTGDILAAAQDIEILSAVGDDVRAAARTVRIAGPVAGHIVAAGQTVSIEERIGDWAWISGNTVEISGNIGGDVEITANRIEIDAEVDGDARLTGSTLHLGPDAMVRGDLRWRSDNKADISPQARIEGQLIEEPLPEGLADRGAGGGLMFTLSIIVSVATLFLLFPRWLRASANQIATRPVASLALGFALLVATPVLALLLLLTRLGAWIAMAVLGGYLVALLIGILTGLFAVSDLTLRRFQPQPQAWQALSAIFVTVAAVGLLSQVPWVGSVTVFAICLLGVGALGLQLARGYASAR